MGIPTKVNELWVAVFGLLLFFCFVEYSHLQFHKGEEAPQCRTPSSLALASTEIPFAVMTVGTDHKNAQQISVQ